MAKDRATLLMPVSEREQVPLPGVGVCNVPWVIEVTITIW
jgi:hypothetical protein